MTYYPSAKTPETAMPVTVNVRAPAPANITLSNAPLAVIAGTVLDHQEPSRPRTAAAQRPRRHLFGGDARAVQLREGGRFALAGMPPGTYFLQMREGQWPPPREGETPLISGGEVVGGGGDAEALGSSRARGGGGRGGSAPTPPAGEGQAGRREGGEEGRGEGNPGPERPGSVTDDFRFDFRTWPGPHAIRVTIDSQAWTVKAISYKGPTSPPAESTSGTEEITGLEIELARAGSNRQP